MIKNYLSVALRNLGKHRVFTFLNIIGLSIGITCCLFIFLFVQDELKYDQFHEKKDRIYRLTYQINNLNLARVSHPLQPLLETNLPEIEKTAKVYVREAGVRINTLGLDKSFEEDNVFFVDSSFADIFTLEPIAGNIQASLNTPFKAILSAEAAERYFETTNFNDLIGKPITLQGQYQCEVGAIVATYPSASHIRFNMLFAYDTMYEIEGEGRKESLKNSLESNWVISHTALYFLLKDGADSKAMDAKIPDLRKGNVPEQMEIGQQYTLQALNDIHLYSEGVALGFEPAGNIEYVYLFSTIAILTLLIACFNFINLSTAQAAKRAKEVGLRKVLGAHKSQLFIQFLGEAAIICSIALISALGLVNLGLPYLNELTGKTLEFSAIWAPQVILGFGVILFITILLGGGYPAFYLSQLKLLVTLKGKQSENLESKFSLRRILILLQLSVSIMLITGAIIVFRQVSFMTTQPLGFNSEAMITVPIFSQNINNFMGGVTGEIRGKLNTLEDELNKHPNVQASSLSNNVPGLGVVARGVMPEGRDPELSAMIMPVFSIDYDFLDTYKIDLLTGRDFDINAGADHLESFIVNEKAVAVFEWGSLEDALGKSIIVEGKEGTVIGVVKDFHYTTLQSPIQEMVFEVTPSRFNVLSIKLNTQNLESTLTEVGAIWNEFFPEKAFDYNFLDRQLIESYQNEQRLGKIIGIFTALAVIVSCLGVYGLMMYSAKQREKEIGVRKVLGASTSKLVLLLFKEFTLLLVFGFLLAIYPTWYLGNEWLSDFTYSISLSAENFVFAGLIMLFIIIGTISYQSLKTALANPAKTLRDE